MQVARQGSGKITDMTKGKLKCQDLGGELKSLLTLGGRLTLLWKQKAEEERTDAELGGLLT